MTWSPNAGCRQRGHGSLQRGERERERQLEPCDHQMVAPRYEAMVHHLVVPLQATVSLGPCTNLMARLAGTTGLWTWWPAWEKQMRGFCRGSNHGGV